MCMQNNLKKYTWMEEATASVNTLIKKKKFWVKKNQTKLETENVTFYQ